MAATTEQLHGYAITAEQNLEQLATGIATVGADDATIKGVTQMAHMCRQIATSLASGAMQQSEPAAPAQTPNDAIAAHMAQRRAAAAQPAPAGY